MRLCTVQHSAEHELGRHLQQYNSSTYTYLWYVPYTCTRNAGKVEFSTSSMVLTLRTTCTVLVVVEPGTGYHIRVHSLSCFERATTAILEYGVGVSCIQNSNAMKERFVHLCVPGRSGKTWQIVNEGIFAPAGGETISRSMSGWLKTGSDSAIILLLTSAKKLLTAHKNCS